MNKIFFRAEEVPLPAWKKQADLFIHGVLDVLGIDNWELSVLFCNNRYVKDLNSRYLGKDEPTDVLSFPNGEIPPAGKRCLAGDIVISLDALDENTRFFRVSKNEELARLLVHGILHLTGDDHSTNKKEEPMLVRQEEILGRLKEIFPSGKDL